MKTGMIAEGLRAHVLSCCEEQNLVDVRIGLGYTAVLLEDGSAGVAYTFHEQAAAGCSVFRGRRPLAGCSTQEVLQYLGSSDPVESAVGLAVANALVNRPYPGQEEGDILGVLSVRPEDRVGMVGYFGPLVAPLEKRVRELTIFERNAARSEKVLPAEEALEAAFLRCFHHHFHRADTGGSGRATGGGFDLSGGGSGRGFHPASMHGLRFPRSHASLRSDSQGCRRRPSNRQ